MKIQASQTQHAQNVSNIVPTKSKDSGGSSYAPPQGVGPAVVLSLTNTAKAPDAAIGDPDHDGS